MDVLRSNLIDGRILEIRENELFKYMLLSVDGALATSVPQERKKSWAKDDPPTYYEKIETDKKKHLSYEIIWQIGDMADTGYDTDNLSAIWTEDMEKNIGWKRLYKGKNERGDLLLSDYRRERAAEKALEAEREKERKENALQQIQTLSEKTIKKLDEEISAKNMTLKLNDALIEIRKSDVEEWEEKAKYSKLEYLKADELLTDKRKKWSRHKGSFPE